MASLNKGEWSCYKDGQFNGGSMVMLLRWPINGERMVILLRWPMEREWSFYGGGQFNGG